MKLDKNVKLKKVLKSVANGLFKMFRTINKKTGIHEFEAETQAEFTDEGGLDLIVTIRIPLGSVTIGK